MGKVNKFDKNLHFGEICGDHIISITRCSYVDKTTSGEMFRQGYYISMDHVIFGVGKINYETQEQMDIDFLHFKRIMNDHIV